MHKPEIIAILALAALLAGCATRALDLAPDRPDRAWVPAVGPAGAIAAGAPARTGFDQTYALPANPALGVLPDAVPIDAAHAYTLPELVDIAESSNPATGMAWDEAKEAALAVGLTRSAFLPRLTATAAGIAEASHGDKTLNDSSVTGPGSGEGAIVATSLQWMLFDFGGRRALVRAAEDMSVVSNIQFDAVHQKIVRDVSVAFYDIAAAQMETTNADRAAADTQRIEDAVAARRARGQATIVDVAQARRASAQARLAAIEARGREANARIALLTAMGVSPMLDLKLAAIPDRLLVAEDGRIAATAVSQALARRPDMLAALASRQASDEGVAAARADFRPKVFLSSGGSYQTGHLDITALPGTGGVDGSDNLTTSKWSGHAIIGVSIPIYDGGMRSAHLAQAQARADGAQADFEHVRDLAIREIVIARTTLQTSVAAFAAAEELRIAAQTSFDASLAAYTNGVGDVTEVEAAEAALMTARSARSAAYGTALSSAADLAITTGALATTPGLADGP